MATKLSQIDFSFQYANYGIWKVTYTSPNTGEKWSAGITDLELIEKTRDARFPKDQDLRQLLKICKTNDK